MALQTYWHKLFHVKEILSPFLCQQTWPEPRHSQVGRQSNQGPFFPDIYIFTLLYMALSIESVWVWARRNALIQRFLFWFFLIHNQRILSGIQLGVAILLCKSKTGKECYHLPGYLDGRVFDVPGYLELAGRWCWKNMLHSEAIWYL